MSNKSDMEARGNGKEDIFEKEKTFQKDELCKMLYRPIYRPAGIKHTSMAETLTSGSCDNNQVVTRNLL